MRRVSVFIGIFALTLSWGSSLKSSLAASPPIDAEQFGDVNALLSDDITKAVVKTIGAGLVHRPYQPATPLGTKIGLDLGVEATIVKIPDDFNSALSSAGNSGNLTILPSPKVHLAKGMGRVDIALSFIGFQGLLVVGGNIQIGVYVPEEGPAYAIRLGYTYAKIGVAITKTITPEILVSRKMGHVEPYLGIGYPYVSGTVTVEIPTGAPEPLPQSVTLENAAKVGSFLAYLGLKTRLGPTGLKLGIEGAYSHGGLHTLGVMFGFSF